MSTPISRDVLLLAVHSVDIMTASVPLSMIILQVIAHVKDDIFISNCPLA